MTTQILEPPKHKTPNRRAQDNTATGHIMHERALDPSFRKKVGDPADGENLLSCIQCGTCGATCPVSQYMDYTPRQIIAMVKEGFKDEVLNSFTIWLCASCYECTVDCPREIRITDLMYSLKREAIAEGVWPKRFPAPILTNKFYRQVQRHGRQNEARLLVTLYLLTNPLNMLRNARVAIRLFMKGRLSPFETGIKDKKGLQTLLRAMDQQKVEAS